MKIIALDYDNTFTGDEVLWRGFIESAQARGHLVICVTFRHATMPVETNPNIEVFYSGGRPKAEFMHEQGLRPDIWIDDIPELIGPTRFPLT